MQTDYAYACNKAFKIRKIRQESFGESVFTFILMVVLVGLFAFTVYLIPHAF